MNSWSPLFVMAVLVGLSLTDLTLCQAFVHPSSSSSRPAFITATPTLFSSVASAELSSTTVSIPEPHGMPWKSSVNPAAFQDEELLYMPFWEWQMDFMKENLTNLRVVETFPDEYLYQENGSKARIVSLCLASDEYRKIRLTYYDAGDNTQVFNSVWYPDPEKYDAPVLGIDVLAFNRKKYLAIVDFQPLHDQHPVDFENILEPIKEKYENLKGRMSSKFYDETQFFSQQMLFSRFEDETIVSNELFPAFQEYVLAHLRLLQQPETAVKDSSRLWELQQAYDTYSAERDPAMGLFTAMFGEEWALNFVHNFLFSLSERPTPKEEDSPVTVPSTRPREALARPQRLQPAVVAA